MPRHFPLALLTLIFLTASVRAADWPLLRGNILQNGVAASGLPERLEIRWKFEIKDGKDGFEGAAAIVGDTVYLACLDENLYAVDLNTGKEKWRYKGGSFRVAPGVRNGAVYVGDLYGVFHCVDAATGKKRWTFDSGTEITSAANFFGDKVLFGSGDETLYCLPLQGKKPVWTFKVPGGPVQGSPAVVGTRTFATGCDSTMHVLDAATGKELASAELGAGSQVPASAAVSGNFLYVGTMGNEVLAVNWQKAEVAWRFKPATRDKPFYAAVAVSGDLVVAGCRNKRAYALDRKTGKEVWNFPASADVESSPVIVGRRVLVGSKDGNLYVLDLANGAQLQKLELDGQLLASPAVGSDCLVIGLANKGVVYCFGAKK